LVSRAPFIIVIPVYNDWESLDLLLQNIDRALSDQDIEADIFVVDDGSTRQHTFDKQSLCYRAIRRVEVLTLKRNLGHQRAIAVGLAYIEENFSMEAVIVMDADGEDKPTDIIRLIEKWKQEPDCIIFAERTKRSEQFWYRVSYRVYQIIYWLLTGNNIFMGNFSLIPVKQLKRVVVISEIWNSFCSGIQRAKIQSRFIPTERGYRLAGKSKMNLVSLIIHGLGSISVFSDIVGIRAMIFSFISAMIVFLGIVVVILVRFATTLAIPGWATYTLGLLFVMFIQFVSLSLIFAFIILSSRNNVSFIPKKDYHLFVLELNELYSYGR